jgi:AcrR family transcriptional regulator
MQRLTRERWLDAAFEALDTAGHEAVSAQALCRRLGVTRGAFYHHFSSHPAFVQALLRRWEQRYTGDVIAHAQGGAAAQERLQRYLQAIAALSPRCEVALRAWARENATVREAVQRAERERLRFARDMARALLPADAPASSVDTFAQAAWLGLVGLQQCGEPGSASFARFLRGLLSLAAPCAAPPGPA